MDKEEETINLAKEIIDDAELKRTSVEALVFKATRLAALVNNDEMKTWLTLERFGYSDKQPDLTYMAMTGRSYNKDTRIGYWGSIATQESAIEANLSELEVVKGFKPSGTYSAIQFSGQIQQVKNFNATISLYRNICSRVASRIQDFATNTYHATKFGQEASSLLKKFSLLATEGISKYFPEVSQSFDVIYKNATNTNPRGRTAAALECRNILINLSEFLWQSIKTEYKCRDGDVIKVNNEKNKLIAYVDTKIDGSNEGRAKAKKLFGMIHEIFTLGAKSKRKIDISELQTVIVDTVMFINDLLTYTDRKPIE